MELKLLGIKNSGIRQILIFMFCTVDSIVLFPYPLNGLSTNL